MATIQPKTPLQLRQRAEELYQSDESHIPESASSEEMKLLLHELRVHQIELEMQNEELRCTQGDLEKVRARYFDLYDLAPVGYLTFSADGLIIEANLTIAAMLGLARTALLNKKLSHYIFRDDQDRFYLNLRALIESNSAQSWELRLLRSDGSSFWSQLQAIPAQAGEYWITVIDISSRKHAEEEQRILQQQLQQSQKLESLGVLAGGIAHDFNNILSVIMGYCSLIMLRPASVSEFAAEILSAAERAAALCRQMLAYAGKTTLEMKLVDMKVLVQEMVRMLHTTTPPNVQITLNLAPDVPVITGDASQIRQIAMNLIINAAEAIGTAQGSIVVDVSQIVITAGDDEYDHLGTSITPGRYLLLQVTDNGCGMDAETKRRIFEPFFSTKFTGRGLGMAATLGIISAHGGALQLTSQPGQGSCFKVYLPVQVHTGSEHEVLQPVTPAGWQGTGMVLLVEDEEVISLLAKTMLEELGFSTVTAANGQEALEKYRQYSATIILVIADLGMPVMDGFDLLNILKKLNPQLPIIISSGYGDMTIAERIPSEAIAGTLSKPYHFDQMREVLQHVLENRP